MALRWFSCDGQIVFSRLFLSLDGNKNNLQNKYFKEFIISSSCCLFLNYFFNLSYIFLFSPSETSSSQSPNYNKCPTKVLSNTNKAIVSWSGNVKKLTADLYSGICFGKFHHYSPITILCWNKTTETFSFLSQYDDQNFKNPQVKINEDGGGIAVSVEVPVARNTGLTVFWDVQWAGMHNRVIDEMLFCSYKVQGKRVGILHNMGTRGYFLKGYIWLWCKWTTVSA